jgi:hypothetical protein
MEAPRPRRRRIFATDHPLLWTVGLACAAVVVLEIFALNGFFGIAAPWTARPAPAPPDLNPHHQTIVAIWSNISYVGLVKDYFPSLNGTGLCGGACPELPRQWTPPTGNRPTEIGVLFYYNITNEAALTVNLSAPIVMTSGADPTLFFLETFCCYSTVNQPYGDQISTELAVTGGTQVGLEGYAFTTVTLPVAESGGYTLFVNFTSN